ncbi:MAG: hypothetical protein WCJ24_01085 [Candidatus Saccharibacteria bacterium]
MTHALSDILADRFEEEPGEIKAIKTYVRDNFGENIAIAVRDKQLIITTQSAALAGALRPHLYKLQKLSGDDMRLTIRIGH